MKNKFSYRYKKEYVPKGHSNEWKGCTKKQKEKIEKMAKGKVEFKENTPPKPTPNMEE